MSLGASASAVLAYLIAYAFLMLFGLPLLPQLLLSAVVGLAVVAVMSRSLRRRKRNGDSPHLRDFSAD